MNWKDYLKKYFSVHVFTLLLLSLMTALQSQNMQENETKCFVPDALIMCTGLLFNQLKVKQRLVFFREIHKKFPALAGHSSRFSIPWINGKAKILFKNKKATTPKVTLFHLSSHLPDLLLLCFHYSMTLSPDKILLTLMEPFAILTFPVHCFH